MAELNTDTDEIISDTETEYIIGDDNCQFHTIVRILEPENSTNFDQKLIDIAIDLNIPGGTIAHWRREVNFGNLSNDVLLYELLIEFRSIYASEATVRKFIDALYKKDLFQEAENLAAHFGIDLELDKEFVQLRTNKDTLAKLGCGISVALTVIIFGFTCIFPYLQNDDNEPLLGCPISSMINEEMYNTSIQWAENIQSSNVSQIYNILHNCEFSNKTSFVLFNSVSAAYHGNITNFPAVLKFVQEIFYPMYRYTGHSALLASMQENQHDYTSEMFKLAYFIKTTMDDKSCGIELHQKYTNLTNLVVKDIHALIFRKCVKIHNTHFPEYMVLSRENSQYFVITKNYDDIKKYDDPYWYFDVRFENNQLFFLIQKNYYRNNSSVCSSLEHFENLGEKTVECNSHSELHGRWVVEPIIVANYHLFTIKRPDGCLFYSPDQYDSQTKIRYALTWSTRCSDTSYIPGG